MELVSGLYKQISNNKTDPKICSISNNFDIKTYETEIRWCSFKNNLFRFRGKKTILRRDKKTSRTTTTTATAKATPEPKDEILSTAAAASSS